MLPWSSSPDAPLVRSEHGREPHGWTRPGARGALLRDEGLQASICDLGVAVVEGAVPVEALEAFDALFQGVRERVSGSFPEHWFATGMLDDPDLQRWLYEAATPIARRAIEPMLTPDAVVHAGSFAVKPPGPRSVLGMHQDVSMVDERRWRSLNAWIPLVDTTEENGALRFVLGSHRFGNLHRSLALPWAFEELHEVMEEHAITVHARRGDLILFDTAMIHGSPANSTPWPRAALQCLILPGGVAVEHLRQGAETPAGTVEVHAIDPDDLLGGPPTGSESRGRHALRSLIRPNPTRSDFRAWCEAMASHSGADVKTTRLDPSLR